MCEWQLLSLVCFLTIASNVLSGKGVQGSHPCVPALGSCLGLELGLTGQWRSTHSTATLGAPQWCFAIFFILWALQHSTLTEEVLSLQDLKSKGKSSEDLYLGRDRAQ